MPYVKQSLREKLDAQIVEISDTILKIRGVGGQASKVGGVCNYAITRILLRSMKEKWGYTTISDVQKVAQNVADEIGRRMLGPYEDHASQLNGDVEEFAEFEDELRGTPRVH